MNELLQRASMNESGNTGTAPTLQAEGQTRPYTISEDIVMYSESYSEEQKPKSPTTPESLEASQQDKSKESDGKDKNGEGNYNPILFFFFFSSSSSFFFFFFFFFFSD
jgi:hypothetical protein